MTVGNIEDRNNQAAQQVADILTQMDSDSSVLDPAFMAGIIHGTDTGARSVTLLVQYLAWRGNNLTVILGILDKPDAYASVVRDIMATLAHHPDLKPVDVFPWAAERWAHLP